MLTKEDWYLKRGAIIVKRRAVSACASTTAGLDKACPRDLGGSYCRHVGCNAWAPGLTSRQPQAVLAENARAFEDPSVKVDNPAGLLGLTTRSLSGQHISARTGLATTPERRSVRLPGALWETDSLVALTHPSGSHVTGSRQNR
jgi:hypothetical protein